MKKLRGNRHLLRLRLGVPLDRRSGFYFSFVPRKRLLVTDFAQQLLALHVIELRALVDKTDELVVIGVHFYC